MVRFRRGFLLSVAAALSILRLDGSVPSAEALNPIAEFLIGRQQSNSGKLLGGVGRTNILACLTPISVIASGGVGHCCAGHGALLC